MIEAKTFVDPHLLLRPAVGTAQNIMKTLDSGGSLKLTNCFAPQAQDVQ